MVFKFMVQLEVLMVVVLKVCKVDGGDQVPFGGAAKNEKVDRHRKR